MPLTIETIKAQEEACVLPTFDSNVAFELGSRIRAICQQRFTEPVVVYVSLANSTQILFYATTGSGSLPDNMHWIKRKEAVVLRWGAASMRMKLQIEEQFPGLTTQEALKARYELAEPSGFALHGGGFPIRVKSVEGVVGVIVVSGLEDEDDHGVVVEAIQEYLAKQ